MVGTVASRSEPEDQSVGSKKEHRISKRKPRVTSLGVLIFLSIIWGLAFVAIRRADYELSPVNLGLLRWLVASAGFLAILPILGKPKTKFETRKDLARLLFLSFDIVVAYNLLINYAEQTISAGLGGLFNSLSPIFVALLSIMLLKETISLRLIVALVVALLGAVILAFPDLGSTTILLLGPLSAIAAMLAFSFFSVVAKPLIQKYGAAPVTIWAGLLGTLMLLPLLPFSNFLGQILSLSIDGWISVLYLSLGVSVTGYSVFYTLLKNSAVSKLSVQLYLIPLVGVIGGVILLGETIEISTILGGGFLICAIALAVTSKS